jgi:hypothetical protein
VNDTIQFHSILHGLWPVTQNTDSALRQPPNFGVTPGIQDNFFWKFYTSKEIWPMSHILHPAPRAVTRDQDQNPSRHRGCIMCDCPIEWNGTAFFLAAFIQIVLCTYLRSKERQFAGWRRGARYLLRWCALRGDNESLDVFKKWKMACFIRKWLQPQAVYK